MKYKLRLRWNHVLITVSPLLILFNIWVFIRFVGVVLGALTVEQIQLSGLLILVELIILAVIGSLRFK